MTTLEELHRRLSAVDPGYYTLERCREIYGKLERIRELKIRRNAVLLAHSYQRPEIFPVADFVGDSLGLSLQAAEVGTAEVIVFCGVHFMAEIAKIVSPSRIVLLPNLKAGCSLADTAAALDVERRIAELRSRYPDLGVVAYVNTSAEVKALADACCTSSNAVAVTRALPNSVVLFLPDQNLARHVAAQVPEKTVIPWEGNCYVHHELQPANILALKRLNPDMRILVHPECREDVVKLADAALSTSGMVDYARRSEATKFLAVTECGLSDLLAMQVPGKQFFRACKVCRFMKMITLDDVLASLENLQPEISVPEPVRARAEQAIRRMFELTSPEAVPASLASVID